MDTLYALCLIGILSVPGIYVACNKHFLVSGIPEYDRFFIRFILLAPALAGVSWVVSTLLWMMPLLFFSITTDFLTELVSNYLLVMEIINDLYAAIQTAKTKINEVLNKEK